MADLSVPLHIRNAPTRLMKNLGYGKDYQYSHSYENNFQHRNIYPKNYPEQNFMIPGKMQEKKS
jgi:putative ATPase